MVNGRFSVEPHGKHQGAAMSGSLSPFPLVSEGAHDHPVRTLQDLLNEHGYGLVVDGPSAR